MTEDVTSQTYFVLVTKNAVSQKKLTSKLIVIVFKDPFSTMTEGVASLDYWSTDEVVYPEIYLL